MPRFFNRIAPGSPPVNATVHPLLWGTVGLWAVIQLLTDLADAGLAPRIFEPWGMYYRFAFDNGDLQLAFAGRGVDPQMLWALVTHAFLHAGWLHLATNAAIFLAFGHGISHDAGIRATLVIFLLTAAAGALTYGLLSSEPGALVGASGGTSGFIGVFLCWRERWLARHGMARDQIWLMVGALAALNLMVAVGVDSSVAWQAHLGGFVVGWLLGYAVPPRRHSARSRARFL
ncbi:MAG: rhomboid family intramembrane serine protease [Pseudomonadota bacterium]